MQSQEDEVKEDYECSSLADSIESQWSEISSLRSLEISDKKVEHTQEETLDPSFQDSDMQLVPNEDEVKPKEADLMMEQLDKYQIEIARNKLFGHNQT